MDGPEEENSTSDWFLENTDYFVREWVSDKINARIGRAAYESFYNLFKFSKPNQKRYADGKLSVAKIKQLISQEEDLEEDDLYIIAADQLSQDAVFEALGESEQSIRMIRRNLYLKALQSFINNHAEDGWFHGEKSTKALHYTKIADLLEQDESLHILLQDEDPLSAPFVKIKASLYSPLPPLKAMTKQDLYLEALLVDPSLKEAFVGLENLSMPSYNIQTNGFISKQELYDKTLKILQTPIDQNMEQNQEFNHYPTFRAQYEASQNFERSSQITEYVITSLSKLYLHVIEHRSSFPYPYYFLAEHLQENETVQLFNKVQLTKKGLYQRAVQLMIDEPSAYYRLACRLLPGQGVPLFNQKTVLSKLDLLAKAFILKPDSAFYLTELVKYIKSLPKANTD